MLNIQEREKLYIYRNILENVDGEYIMTNPITDTNIKEMRNNMDESDIEGFDKFVERNWGSRKKETVQAVATAEGTTKRGRPRKNEI